MPIYTYKCKNCGKIIEKLKPMSSNGSEICDHCSGEAIRVFSPAGIIFKGSGFYTTDYKSTHNKKAGNTSQSGTGEKNSDEKSSDEKSQNEKKVESDSKKNQTNKDIKKDSKNKT
jgi:putative FmdB family regulatory protein